MDIMEVDIQDPSQIAGKINALSNVALLYVCTDPMITANQDLIISTANAKKLPTMFAFRDYVERGGLMSHGPDFASMFAIAAQRAHAFLSGTSLHKLRHAAAAPLHHKLVINTLTEAAIQANIPQGVRNQAELWPAPL